MIWASGVFTGVFWLLMGLTGAITWIQKITTKPVVRGIMLGLGLSFVVEGLSMMRTEARFAIGGVVLTLVLLSSKRYPARFRWPEIGLPQISWNDLLAGCIVLGLLQAPLTLGNAIIGTVAENNEYFPDRPVTAKVISIDHGVMNLISPCIGGIPLCHGAGGMAGHIRFGARTGGALVILGVIVLLAGLLFSDSIALILQIFPRSVLGVILFFAGIELALVVKDVRLKKQNLFVLLITAGTAMWNMGIAYLAGLLLYYGLKRQWIRI
jgi:hypothetical protein